MVRIFEPFQKKCDTVFWLEMRKTNIWSVAVIRRKTATL